MPLKRGSHQAKDLGESGGFVSKKNGVVFGPKFDSPLSLLRA